MLLMGPGYGIALTLISLVYSLVRTIVQEELGMQKRPRLRLHETIVKNNSYETISDQRIHLKVLKCLVTVTSQ